MVGVGYYTYLQSGEFGLIEMANSCTSGVA